MSQTIVPPVAAGVPPAAVTPASAPQQAQVSPVPVTPQPVAPAATNTQTLAPQVAAPQATQPTPAPIPVNAAGGTAPTPVSQPVPVSAPTPAAVAGAQPVEPQSGDGPAPTGIANVSTDKLVEAYVQLRDDKESIQTRHKLELKQHNDMLEKIAGELDARLVREGVKTFSTEHGSATRIITTNAVCNDWSAFEEWLWQTKRLDVFPKKLNYTPFKEMAENDEPLPPGVRLEKSARVQVRRKS